METTFHVVCFYPHSIGQPYNKGLTTQHVVCSITQNTFNNDKQNIIPETSMKKQIKYYVKICCECCSSNIKYDIKHHESWCSTCGLVQTAPHTPGTICDGVGKLIATITYYDKEDT